MSWFKALACFLVMLAGNLLATSALAGVVFASLLGSDSTGDGSLARVRTQSAANARRLGRFDYSPWPAGGRTYGGLCR